MCVRGGESRGLAALAVTMAALFERVILGAWFRWEEGQVPQWPLWASFGAGGGRDGCAPGTKAWRAFDFSQGCFYGGCFYLRPRQQPWGTTDPGNPVSGCIGSQSQ